MGSPDTSTQCVLLVATEWEPSKGGVSSFNQELAAALARTGHEVHCAVDAASAGEIAHAKSLSVTLHSAADRGVPPGTPFDLRAGPNIVIGHDRWTGHAAARWHERLHQARLVHILHVHPGQIDGMKNEESIRAREGRVRNAVSLARHADLVFAVGPLLADRWRSDLHGIEVHQLTPGLPDLLPGNAGVRTAHPRVLVLGRAEDAELKGVELASEAMRRVAGAYPDVELLIRGVAPGTVDVFEAKVRRTYRKPRRLECRTFSASRDVVAADLASAWVVLQPSLEEGFGLVTLEALAVGTPVLVSARSGVAQMLMNIDSGAADQMIVTGFDPADWAAAIEGIVVGDVDGPRTLAMRLADEIRAAHTWDAAAKELLVRVQRAPTRTHSQNRKTLVDEIRDGSASLRRVRRTIDGNWIARDEESAIFAWLDKPVAEDDESICLLVGGPGTGKSAVLGRLVERADDQSVPVLGIKADYVPAGVQTLDALRAHLGLTQPVDETLRRAVATYGRALLIIDQLDALCELVDARTRRLSVLVELLRLASSIDGLRTLASVRPFELQHEARLRAMQQSARTIVLPGLRESDVASALPGLRIPSPLPIDLATPHALDLMVELRRRMGARFSFPASAGDLREAFWRESVSADASHEASARQLAKSLGDSGSLWIEPSAAGLAPKACDSLLDRGLLQKTPDGRIGFRHQTLFDLARARDLLEQGRLTDFVIGHQEQLEVRPLIRSALMHLRSAASGRYATILTDRTRSPGSQVDRVMTDTQQGST